MRKPADPTEASRESILDAAAAVFAGAGFAGARVEAIARAAGMNKAMLYYRLGGKARLYELTLARHFTRLAEAVEAAAAANQGPPRQRLSALLAALSGSFAADPRLPRLMAWELASGGKTVPPGLLSVWSRIMRPVAEVAAPLGLDPVLLYFTLVGPLVFTCLTEPVRRRFAAALPPPLAHMGGLSVADMSGFLAGLLHAALREDPPC